MKRVLVALALMAVLTAATQTFQLTVQTPPSGPTIAVNGASNGITVTPGAAVSVTVAGGPAARDDWMGICNAGVTPSAAQCDGAGYDWAWVDNCTKTGTPPPAGLAANTCTLHAPGAAGNYVATFFHTQVYTSPLVSAPFTVGGGTASITGVTVSPSSCVITPPATTCSFSGTLTATCSVSPCPGPVTFSLLAGAATASLSANPTSITAGQSSTLTWSSTNASSCVGTGFSTGNLTSGTASVSPVSTATYSVTCGTATASAMVSVSGGGGGPVQPFGSIPCPHGCTWHNVYNADFTTMSSSATIADSVNGPTSAWFWSPVDGTTNPDSGSTGTTACFGGGMIDKSHLPGYLALHAVGTIAWETSGGLSCPLIAKTTNTGQSPPGCNAGTWYDHSTCLPTTKPELWEYQSQEAVNQLNQVTLMGNPSWDGGPGNVGGETANCLDLKYFGESRGNNTHIYNSFKDWEAGCNAGFQTRDFTDHQSDGAPHVMTLVFDPQVGWTSYWDGVLQTSPTYPNGVVNTFGCSPTSDCMDRWTNQWWTEIAISPNCGGSCGAGGTWALYWLRGYYGQ